VQAIWRAVGCAARGESALNLQAPSSSVYVARGPPLPLGAYGEVCAHIAPGKLSAATPAAFHPRSRRPSTLNLQGPASSLHVARGPPLPLGAYGEVCAHIAPGKLSATTPTAFHPRPTVKSARIWRRSAPRRNPNRIFGSP
jgi:hypothetical protein